MGNYIKTVSGAFSGGTVAGATNFTSTLSSGGTDLSTLFITEHNSLSGIQGGAVGEYYHLTSSGHSYYQDILSGTISANTNFTGTISSGGTDLSSLFAPTTPAGSSNEVQYNTGGAFASSANFRYVSSENRLIVGTSSSPADQGESLYVSGPTLVAGALSATTNVKIGRRAIFGLTTSSISSIGVNTINCALGSIQALTIDSSPVTLSYSNAEIGTYIFVLTNSGTRTISLTTAAGWHTPSGVAPTLTSTSGAVNVITAIYDGSKMLVTSTANYTQV